MYHPTQKSDVPVLILNAEEDPQNPPANVATTAEVYPNSKVLFEPYRGHYTPSTGVVSPKSTRNSLTWAT